MIITKQNINFRPMQRINLMSLLFSSEVQGVPKNIGINRRLKYRLWIPIIVKWRKVHQKRIDNLMSFPKWGLLILNIDRDILEIPTLVVFGINCFYCDTTKLCLRNNTASNKDDIRNLHLILMFIGTPCIFL